MTIHHSQLILLEGLPGAGKSTNSRIIMSTIEQMVKRVRWFHEVARPHPTLFFHEANLTKEEYKMIIDRFPTSREILENISIELYDTVSIDLLELEWNYGDETGKGLLTALAEYDVWEFPLGKYMKVAEEKWRHFVELLKKEKDLVVILDSSIFQFQIYTFLEKNTPYETLENFINRLFSIISDVNPSLIYLYRENVEVAIAHIERARGTEFMERIWQRDCHQPYYQNRPTGAEGYREFLRDYHKIADSLFQVTPFKKLGVEISNEDWEKYKKDMISFLDLEEGIEVKDVRFPLGKYINKELNLFLEIQEGYFIDPTGKKKRLIPRNYQDFYVEDLPIILHFSEPDKIIIKGEQLIERWTTEGTVFLIQKPA